jgi:CheY-like chemotaxis protein
VGRILVVDDEVNAALLMRFVLEKSGYSVQTASNGQEALAKLGIEPADPGAALPDIVLLDVMMPVVDGYTVSVRMRQEPRTAAVPILVITCRGDMRHLFEEAPNVAGFLPKPFNPKDLLDAVTKILSRGRSA